MARKARKPFFSIVIPTYNRAKLLKATIAITLLQTFKDFELIISNNCSTDETRQVVKSFKDKRIRYFENKKNIGAEPNMIKAFSYARGKYLFSIGDDDFILYEDTLEKVKKILDKNEYGFIRLNLIERKFIGKGIRKSIVAIEEDKIINKNSSPEKVIEFFPAVGAGHIAGLVIKNIKNISDKMINCHDSPWIRIIYENTQKHGAIFLSRFYMVITWSQGEILNYYDVSSDNKLVFEKYTDYLFSLIPKDELDNFKLKFYSKYIVLQPVIKLYSNNANLIKFNRLFFKLEPRIKKNILFWIFFITAIIVPKSIWRLARVIQHKEKNTLDLLANRKEIYARFNYLNKTHYSV